MTESDKEILTAAEFAKCAGIHYNTVRKMIKSGRLNAFKIGCGGKTSDFRIPKSEIQRLSLVCLQDIVDDMVEKRVEEEKTSINLRFFSKVEKTEGCWIWRGAMTASGYGVFSIKCKYIRAHRASYIIHHGDIPDSSLVLHSCDVRNCVNPDHLHLGTPKQNMDEMRDRGRERKPSGESHSSCKLSDADIEEIKRLRKNKVTGVKIANMFGISLQYVYEIAWGKYRKKKHIERDE